MIKYLSRRSAFVLLACGIIIIGVFIPYYLTRDAAMAATLFFDVARRDGVGAAYFLTAGDFKQIISQADFDSNIRNHNLNEVADISWSSRSYRQGMIYLRGKITLISGEEKLISVSMVEENGQWRLFNLSEF